MSTLRVLATLAVALLVVASVYAQDTIPVAPMPLPFSLNRASVTVTVMPGGKVIGTFSTNSDGLICFALPPKTEITANSQFCFTINNASKVVKGIDATVAKKICVPVWTPIGEEYCCTLSFVPSTLRANKGGFAVSGRNTS
jgi:hypothetical protein